MNSKQRKKDKKARDLIKLGRVAKVAIDAAYFERDSALSEVERVAAINAAKEQALRDGMAKATSLEEAIGFAEARIEEAKAQHDAALKEYRESAERTLERQARELTEAFDTALAEERLRHAEELADANYKTKDAERELARVKKLVEEPERLRRRLRAKQQENDRLTDELNKALQRPTEALPVIMPVGSVFGGR